MDKIILAHQKIPTRLGALKQTNEFKDKFFLSCSVVMTKRIRLADNRIARIGIVTDDEFRAWMLGLIAAQGLSNPLVLAIKRGCQTEILDECARWDLVNRLRRLEAFREHMFVVEGGQA